MLESERLGGLLFPQYDAMSTADLQEFLQTATEQLQADEARWDELVYAAKLYAERMQEIKPPHCTAEESLEAFCKKHPETQVWDFTAKHSFTSRKRPSVWRKMGTIAAAIAISVTLITATAYAAGVPLWSAVVEWTKETFRFVWEDEITPGDASLILQKYGVTQDGVPHWIPEGCELTAFEFGETDVGIRYTVGYTQENDTIIFSVSPYNKNDNHLFQQSGETTVYDANGIRYYLFPNLKRMVAVWVEDGCQCDISGEFTKEELKTILDQMNQG